MANFTQTLAFLILFSLLLSGCRPPQEAELEPISTALITPNGSTLELPAYLEPLAFEAGEVVITTRAVTFLLQAEFAQTPEEWARGLMYRTSLPEDAAMLFLFEREQKGALPRHNISFPVSIAYINEFREINEIHEIMPCPDPDLSACARHAEQHRPLRPYRYALEANHGYFRQRSIGVGDEISFSP